MAFITVSQALQIIRRQYWGLMHIGIPIELYLVSIQL